MDDSGVCLMVSAPASPLPGDAARTGALPHCAHLPQTCGIEGLTAAPGVEMFCYEDPRSLSPEVAPREPTSVSCKRPRKDSVSEFLHPLNTPIKRRRLSKHRNSLVDAAPVHLSEVPQDGSTLIAPLRPPSAHLHLAGPAESSSCADDRKRVLRAKEEDHAGFLPYEMDIYLHRRSIELRYHPVECLLNQPQLSPGMRGVLVEWLTKLCRRFPFAQDTLFLTTNILDRFLVTTPISRDIFQLLGITSLLIAAKQEEQYPPEIAELLQLCDDSYTREQVRQLERVVLCRLRFDLMAPTAQFFLEHHAALRMRTVELANYTGDQLRQTVSVARYLLELVLQDYSLCQYAPSLLALSVLEVSDQVLQHCTRLGALYSGGYSREALDECMTDLRQLTTVFQQSTPDMNAIYARYMYLYTSEEC